MNPGVTALFETVFEWTWRTSLHASVLILLVLGALWFGRRWLTPRGRYALGLLVLIRLMLPMVPESSTSLFRFLPAPAEAVIEMAPVETAAGFEIPLAPVRSFEPEAHPPQHPPRRQGGAWKWIWLAGLTGTLGTLLRRHHRFARAVARRPVAADARLGRALAEAQALMGITRPLPVVEMEGIEAPAVFGLWRPRLLWPAGWAERLTENELRLVLMHELAHVQRRDVGLNWIMLLVRSWHWFNPLVWWAMRRLRADRELVCDALVMARLNEAERRTYGRTLIKLVGEIPRTRLCPSAVRAVNNKGEIKRRVIMITKYRSISRLAFLGSAALAVGLFLLTFTRPPDARAESPSSRDEPELAGAEAAGEQPDLAKTRVEARRAERRTELLRTQLDTVGDRARATADEMNRLQAALGIPSDMAEGRAGAGRDGELHLQWEQALHRQEIEAAQFDALSQALRGEGETPAVLSVAQPDSLLSELLHRLSETELQLAEATLDYGGNHPTVLTLKRRLETLHEQTQARTDAIITGLRVRALAAAEGVDTLRSRLAQLREQELQSRQNYRPFFDLKRELEVLQKTQDDLRRRLLEQELRLQELRWRPEAEEPED